MNNTNNLDNFFSYVSKAVIIIPIFIFVFALIFKFGQTKTGLINQAPTLNSVCTGQACLTPTATVNKIPIDLIGPWVCNYQEGQKQYNLFIKNKNILLKITQNNIEKKYLLTSYAPMIENLLKQDLSTLQSMANQYNINLKTAFDSCRKEDIKNSVFE